MKLTLLFLFVFTLSVSFAQETNGGKKLWAKSILNQKAPELVVQKWITQQPVTTGKFILVDFWATWCGPCRRAIPELNIFSKKFGDRLVVIGISDEPVETVNQLKDVKIEYYSAVDTRARVKNKLNVTGIPHCILIDPKGIVRWEGFPSLDGAPLTEEVIANLLEKYK
jgi:cytochrome c biogenesis protein CcmG, thiol:disulfide interchange protein DsbE